MAQDCFKIVVHRPRQTYSSSKLGSSLAKPGPKELQQSLSLLYSVLPVALVSLLRLLLLLLLPWISLEHPSLTGPGKELHTRNFRGNGTAT